MFKYGFFNSVKQMNGEHDRIYDESDVNRYLRGAISRDGIYQCIGNQCRVMANGDMNIVVKDGRGLINYHWFEVTSNEVLSINKAHATFDRWTAVVARYDAINRNIYLLTIDGKASYKPVKPILQKSEILRDICLAYIYVKAKTTRITSDDIIDTIEDEKICGFVSTLVPGVDAITIVNQLPTASESNLGYIYYLTDKMIIDDETYEKGYYHSEWSNVDSKYKWYPWGKGSEDEHFATIIVNYTPGHRVYITHDETEVSAPDTSGKWTYECDNSGIYVVYFQDDHDPAVGDQKECFEITIKNQIKEITFYAQQFNFAFIYYLGDECEYDGSDRVFKILTGGWEICNDEVKGCVGFKTKNTIKNLRQQNYEWVFMFGHAWTYSNSTYYRAIGIGSGYNLDSSENYMNDLHIFGATNNIYYNDFVFKSFLPLQINSDTSILFASINKAPGGTYTNTKENTSLYVNKGANAESSMGYVKTWVNAIGFLKADNIDKLKKYGNDYETILGHSQEIFQDAELVKWMAFNCTGDFMFTALSNSNFVSSMNASINKDILVDNRVWYKFLSLMSLV